MHEPCRAAQLVLPVVATNASSCSHDSCRMLHDGPGPCTSTYPHMAAVDVASATFFSADPSTFIAVQAQRDAMQHQYPLLFPSGHIQQQQQQQLQYAAPGDGAHRGGGMYPREQHTNYHRSTAPCCVAQQQHVHQQPSYVVHTQSPSWYTASSRSTSDVAPSSSSAHWPQQQQQQHVCYVVPHQGISMSVGSSGGHYCSSGVRAHGGGGLCQQCPPPYVDPTGTQIMSRTASSFYSSSSGSSAFTHCSPSSVYGANSMESPAAMTPESSQSCYGSLSGHNGLQDTSCSMHGISGAGHHRIMFPPQGLAPSQVTVSPGRGSGGGGGLSRCECSFSSMSISSQQQQPPQQSTVQSQGATLLGSSSITPAGAGPRFVGVEATTSASLGVASIGQPNGMPQTLAPPAPGGVECLEVGATPTTTPTHAPRAAAFVSPVYQELQPLAVDARTPRNASQGNPESFHSDDASSGDDDAASALPRHKRNTNPVVPIQNNTSLIMSLGGSRHGIVMPTKYSAGILLRDEVGVRRM